jgi:hypothetical protein
MTVADNRNRLKDRLGSSNLDQDDYGRHHRNGRRGVHYDAQRAMVGIAFELMRVRHLDHGDQRQQEKAYHGHNRQSAWLWAAITRRICLKSCQPTIPCIKDTQNWTHEHRRGLRLGAARTSFAAAPRLPWEQRRRSFLPHLRRPTAALKAGFGVIRRHGTGAFHPTEAMLFRLNCWAMNHFAYLRHLLTGSLAILLLAATATAAQTPLQLKPGVPGMATNHRLILKDGSYQLVRKYEIVGDRVRYISIERTGDWEELPSELVDWDATRKWEREHANQAEEAASPAMKEAQDLDKEEAEQRAAQKARTPEVAENLELPDRDGVFARDIFRGTPELVELTPTELGMNAKTKHGIGTLNPMAGAKASLELEGAHAKVNLHVNDPAIFLSLNDLDDAESVISHALTVNTGGAKDVANRKHGAHSATSGFAIVHVDERNAVRIVGAVHMSPTGTVTQDENVMPAKVEVMPGKHWLRITPDKPLTIGEYALVEILSASDINQSVWDFRVDPQMADNPEAEVPVLEVQW